MCLVVAIRLIGATILECTRKSCVGYIMQGRDGRGAENYVNQCAGFDNNGNLCWKMVGKQQKRRLCQNRRKSETRELCLICCGAGAVCNLKMCDPANHDTTLVTWEEDE